MVKIHGLVYVIVGLFVSIFSYQLNYEKLVFFFYIGLIFVVVGIAKIIFGLIGHRKNEASAAHHKAQHQQQVKYCSKCGNVLKLHDRFCSRCGAGA